MTDPRFGDHATGLELQIEELGIRLERARREHRSGDVHAIEIEITALRLELAETADHATSTWYRLPVIRGIETAARLVEDPRTA